MWLHRVDDTHGHHPISGREQILCEKVIMPGDENFWWDGESDIILVGDQPLRCIEVETYDPQRPDNWVATIPLGERPLILWFYFEPLPEDEHWATLALPDPLPEQVGDVHFDLVGDVVHIAPAFVADENSQERFLRALLGDRFRATIHEPAELIAWIQTLSEAKTAAVSPWPITSDDWKRKRRG